MKKKNIQKVKKKKKMGVIMGLGEAFSMHRQDARSSTKNCLFVD